VPAARGALGTLSGPAIALNPERFQMSTAAAWPPASAATSGIDRSAFRGYAIRLTNAEKQMLVRAFEVEEAYSILPIIKQMLMEKHEGELPDDYDSFVHALATKYWDTYG
jgi:hypothetical protein